MADWAYGLAQGIGAGARAGSGLIDASLKEEADIRAADKRLADAERLQAAQEAMQERIAENAYQRQQRPNMAAGELLRDAANAEVAASSEYSGPAVNVTGTPDEVRAKLSAIPDPVERAKALQAYEQQEAAKVAAEGKTRAPTRDEAIKAAMDAAIQKGDAVSYERLRTLAGDKYVPLNENGLLNTTDGTIVGGGTSKADRERERDERQYENRLRLQSAEDEAKDARAMKMADAAIARDEEKARRKKLEPLPATALKLRQSELDAIGNSSGIQENISRYEKMIDKGELQFGLVGNYINRGMNAVGASTEESKNYASFVADMEKLRNDSLRLNAGVQTDGDAQRAWNELFANINDTKVVKQRLEDIKRYNQRAVEIRKNNVNLIQENYNRDPFDFSSFDRPMDKAGAPQNGGVAAPAMPAGWSVTVRN